MARQKKTKVFVSYSRHDEALVRPLAGLLGVAAEDAVFLDVSSLKPGDLWDEKILGAVREASVFVLCWCCESGSSAFAAKEISAALSEGKKKLVPVLFCSAPLPPSMADRQWIDLRGKIVHACPKPHGAKRVQKHKIDRVRMPQSVVENEGVGEVGFEEVPSGGAVPSPQAPPAAYEMHAAQPLVSARAFGSRALLVSSALLALVGLSVTAYFFTFGNPSQTSRTPGETAVSHFDVWLALLGLAFCSACLFALFKGVAGMRRARERAEAANIAAKAASYFEGLNETRS